MRWQWMRSTSAACISARPAARCTRPRTPETRGHRSFTICRQCSRWRFRRCDDPRRASAPSADARARRQRGRARRAGHGDAARRPRRAGDRLSDAAGHHTWPHDSGAPRVHTVLRMPAGSLARVAGYTIAGRRRLREGTLSRDRCDRGRVGDMTRAGPVDELIAKTPDWRGATLGKLRKIVHDADPDIAEDVEWMRPGNPLDSAVWSHEGQVCVGIILKERVRLAFSAGSSLPDPKKLFNAQLLGKSRAIDVSQNEKLDESALKAIVKAAVRHNLAKTRPAKRARDRVARSSTGRGDG